MKWRWLVQSEGFAEEAGAAAEQDVEESGGTGECFPQMVFEPETGSADILCGEPDCVDAVSFRKIDRAFAVKHLRNHRESLLPEHDKGREG